LLKASLGDEELRPVVAKHQALTWANSKLFLGRFTTPRETASGKIIEILIQSVYLESFPTNFVGNLT